MNIGRPAQPMRDQPRGRRGVGRTVDQNESTGRMVCLVGVECERCGRGEVADANLVQTQGFRRKFAERIDVQTMLEFGHRRGNGPRARFHKIRAARQQPILAHPDEMRGELAGNLGPVLRVAQNIAARDIELIGQC